MTAALAAATYLDHRFDHPEPIFIAAAHNEVDTLAKLIEAGEDVDAVNREHGPVLLWAIRNSSHDAVELLLSTNINLNAKTDAGNFLQTAALWSDTTMMKLLLNAGLDPDAPNPWRSSTLHRAVAGVHPYENSVYALDIGVPIDARDWQGATALLIACRLGHADVARLLMDNGADVNAADFRGVTPLMLAAAAGCENTVQMLLDRNANASATSDWKQSVLEYAGWSENKQQIIAIIEAHIAASVAAEAR